MIVCSVCGKLFVPTYMQRKGAAEGRESSCGKECRNALRSRTMSHTNTVYASARMTERNPMSNPESLKKMQRSLKGRTLSVRGGNGTGLTSSEQVLSDATGMLPHIVPTHLGRYSEYPTHYKLDLADPERMLAVEIDGRSHGALERQAQDRKKEAFLKDLGWTILRFTNEQVLEETQTCCDRISKHS